MELDFAWNVGFVRARKAEKMLAKKGRLVGMMPDVWQYEVPEAEKKAVELCRVVAATLSYNTFSNGLGIGERSPR